MTMPNDAETILALEHAALKRWGAGDPDGFLEISAEDVVYFDPYAAKRIDGRAALRALYYGLRGKIHVDDFELIDPRVQLLGEAAVLTFNYVSHAGGEADRWNCTEVYRRKAAGWEIVQTHWSYTAHPAILAPASG
ncbi:MAG TPA: nuclear transport factor 2 family protein [Opitutaceae bacterium]|nr:nuclear transport factor 2 family protein [Opitutaceae bacterium]